MGVCEGLGEVERWRLNKRLSELCHHKVLYCWNNLGCVCVCVSHDICSGNVM